MDGELRDIRGISLLNGERLWLALEGRHGLLEEPPPKDSFIGLTNQRLISVIREGHKQRWVLLSLDNVDSVAVVDQTRTAKPLITGGLMFVGALVVAWAAAALRLEGVVPWIIAGILVVLAAVTASTYVVAEEKASIVFRTRATEVSLPLLTSQAETDAYLLTNAFFEAKAGRFPAIPKGLLAGIPGTDAPEAHQGFSAAKPDATAVHLQESAPGSGLIPGPADSEPNVEAGESPQTERREDV
jgi:hypothetical protein